MIKGVCRADGDAKIMMDNNVFGSQLHDDDDDIVTAPPCVLVGGRLGASGSGGLTLYFCWPMAA